MMAGFPTHRHYGHWVTAIASIDMTVATAPTGETVRLIGTLGTCNRHFVCSCICDSGDCNGNGAYGFDPPRRLESWWLVCVMGWSESSLFLRASSFIFPMHILAVAKDLQFLTLHLDAEGVTRGRLCCPQ